LVGGAVTLLAGYVGSFAFPAAIEIWVWGLFISVFVGGIKATTALLVMPGIFGAQFAWPVTCIFLPSIGVFRRPATMSSVFVFSGCGAVLGSLTTYVRFAARLLYVHPSNQIRFIIASAIAGVILGGIFGFCLWRFDVIYPEATKERSAEA
jgi:hypothetical protein